MGLSQNERLPGLDEDEKLAELISVATKTFSGGGLLARAWGVFMVFIARMSLIAQSFCYFSAVPFKIVLQKLTVDFEKSPGLGLFGKSGAGKQQRFLLS